MRTIRTTSISILALGLWAGSAVGVAAQDSSAIATGTVDYANGTYSETNVDGSMVGESPGVIVVMSDPRLSGTADVSTYGVQAVEGDGFAETGFGTDVFTLTNDDGSWAGIGTSALVLDEQFIPSVMRATWHLIGEGAYDGLSAYLEVEGQEVASGVIVEGASAAME